MAVTSWLKWPAGQIQPSFSPTNLTGVDLLEPRDETVVKTFVQVHADSQPPGLTGDTFQLEMGFGVIAWETQNAENFDLGFFDITDATIEQPPLPLSNPQYPWILNNPYQGSGFGSIFPTLSGVATDGQMMSKAQRKLPQSVGLLMVIQFFVTPAAAELSEFRWFMRGRCLVKDV